MADKRKTARIANKTIKCGTPPLHAPCLQKLSSMGTDSRRWLESLNCPGPDAAAAAAWGDTCHSCRRRLGWVCKDPSAAYLALAHSSLHMVHPAEEVVRSSGVIPNP